MQTYSTEDLTNLNSSQLLHKMDELRALASQLGCEWAEKQMIFKSIKEMLPSTLAIIQSKCRCEKISESRMIALADPEYTSKIKEMNHAEFEMEKTNAKYRAVIKSIEALTSISFVRNSELKLSR